MSDCVLATYAVAKQNTRTGPCAKTRTADSDFSVILSLLTTRVQPDRHTMYPGLSGPTSDRETEHVGIHAGQCRSDVTCRSVKHTVGEIR